MQLDSPLPEESIQQYHQLKGHLTLHLVTAEGVVGEHILDTHVWQKMLCALNVTGEVSHHMKKFLRTFAIAIGHGKIGS